MLSTSMAEPWVILDVAGGKAEFLADTGATHSALISLVQSFSTQASSPV